MPGPTGESQETLFGGYIYWTSSIWFISASSIVKLKSINTKSVFMDGLYWWKRENMAVKMVRNVTTWFKDTAYSNVGRCYSESLRRGASLRWNSAGWSCVSGLTAHVTPTANYKRPIILMCWCILTTGKAAQGEHTNGNSHCTTGTFCVTTPAVLIVIVISYSILIVVALKLTCYPN